MADTHRAERAQQALSAHGLFCGTYKHNARLLLGDLFHYISLRGYDVHAIIDKALADYYDDLDSEADSV